MILKFSELVKLLPLLPWCSSLVVWPSPHPLALSIKASQRGQSWVSVLVSDCRCSKWMQTWWLKKYECILLLLWRWKVWNGSHWAEFKVLAGPRGSRGQSVPVSRGCLLSLAHGPLLPSSKPANVASLSLSDSVPPVWLFHLFRTFRWAHQGRSAFSPQLKNCDTCTSAEFPLPCKLTYLRVSKIRAQSPFGTTLVSATLS